MKDASSARQQSSFKSFHNKAKNQQFIWFVKHNKFSKVKVELNTKQYRFTQHEIQQIINYVKTHYDTLLAYIKKGKVKNYYDIKQTLPDGRNFLVIFYE